VRWIGIVVLLLGFFPALAAGRSPAGWLGVYSEVVREFPEVDPSLLGGATTGLRITAVFPDSPADEGGLLDGDILLALDGEPFTCPPESVRVLFRRYLGNRSPGEKIRLRVLRDAVDRSLLRDGRPVGEPEAEVFWRRPQDVVDTLSLGSTLQARLRKERRVLDLEITLGLRPEARWPAAPPNDQLYPEGLFPESRFAPLLRELVAQNGLTEEAQDLMARLQRTHEGMDPFRLRPMVYAHREPLRLEAVARYVTRALSPAGRTTDLLVRAAPLLSPEHAFYVPVSRRLEPPPEQDLEALLAQVLSVFDEARVWHERAFSALTQEEREFLARERWNLSDAFAGEVYIHFDEDRSRFRKNKRILDLAAKVDRAALLECAARLSLLTDPRWAAGAGALLRRVFADSLDKEILLDRETRHGRILIGGTGRHWYRNLDAAFILDLGGDDFYTGNNGGNNGWDVPLALCIDLAGDDAYESTLKCSQGSGCLGVGGLLDMEGDDNYIGIQWCQGTGYLGVGWLHDLAGDDVYRGRTFCQGVGLFGMGILMDATGNDRYEGDAQVQGVGLAGGLGALVEGCGEDSYYAKGLYPTGYGDAGIFDAWSQGCGMGFRTLASGGIGVLLDGAGRDRMEAGNFSQGGGYYYGFGILEARGRDPDVYIGSRYNQGFSAHQALGVFLEEGGDDFYTTRQAVAQGLAWDECATLFVDASGDDTYQGGRGFSLAAWAHNSLAVFLDLGGRDTYEYRPGPARSGPNTYHGGTSLSFFLDAGAETDTYTAAGCANDTTWVGGEYGIFVDGQGPSMSQ
jgi:hypothetical protein